MNKLKKLACLLLILAFIGFGYLGGWWDGIFQPIPRTIAPLKKNPPPGFVMNETELSGWDQEQKVWEIGAKRIWQTADGMVVYFESINRGIAYSNQKQRVDFTAGWVRWEKLTNELYIGGGIHANLENGSFQTEEAIMQYRFDRMICPHDIKYVEPKLSITAKSMKIDFHKEEMLLEGDVCLVQNNNRVRAQGLIYNTKDEKYRLLTPGGVSLNL